MNISNELMTIKKNDNLEDKDDGDGSAVIKRLLLVRASLI